jgi:predicted Zn-dependent protease
VELKPSAPLLRVNLGQTLIALDDKAKVTEGIQQLKTSLDQDSDNAVAWRLLAEAYDKRGQDGLARLATAEYDFSIGDLRQARVFAMRARGMLAKNTTDWRRATDIVLASQPSKDDLKDLAREGSITGVQ